MEGISESVRMYLEEAAEKQKVMEFTRKEVDGILARGICAALNGVSWKCLDNDLKAKLDAMREGRYVLKPDAEA